MKIKAVCEMTGLTDRAVRYYIEEELLLPSYTKNYLGRKTFDFSDDDVQKLKDIAVLRKLGFSIAEIKQMQATPKESYTIAQALKQRKQSAIVEEQVCIQALDQLDKNRFYTVPKLAAQLSVPVKDEPLPETDSRRNRWNTAFAFIKAFLLGLFVWLPVVLSVLVFLWDLHENAYPVFRPQFFLLLLLSLLPGFFSLFLPKENPPSPWILRFRKYMIVLCVLCFPISPMLSGRIISHSETTNIGNYRNFDVDCSASNDRLFQALFPMRVHTFEHVQQADDTWEKVLVDAKYLYRYGRGWDDSYDIYAQWPLTQAEFDQEVARVQELFSCHPSQYLDYVTLEKGDYTCLFYYDGDPPFKPATNDYQYYIFAYDEENLTVRYIMCYSNDNGAEQPYYLSLDW